MYLEKTESERFWELLRLVMDHPKWKSGEVLWKQTYLGSWRKSRKVSSLKITDQDHTKSTSQFRINSLLKAGTVDQVSTSTSTIHLTASHVKFRSLPASWLKIGYLVLYSRPHVPNEWMPSIGTLEFVPSTFGQTLSNPSVESSTKINQNPIPAGAL
jgi:hypothetical protein